MLVEHNEAQELLNLIAKKTANARRSGVKGWHIPLDVYFKEFYDNEMEEMGILRKRYLKKLEGEAVEFANVICSKPE